MRKKKSHINTENKTEIVIFPRF